MIVELSVENFVIAEKLHIDFTTGFNVLTGETGAGKSIIVDAISLILGSRASRDFIRTGSDKAILEGLFYLEKPKKVKTVLDEYGIDSENNDYLLLTRELYTTGRSVSRINGRTVTLNMLNNITRHLIDIHGQHEHQSLLNPDNHIIIIDSFGDEDFKKLKEEVSNYYNELILHNKRLKEISLDEIAKDREIDLLNYQIEEIDSARLSKKEEDEVFEEYEKLNNIKYIVSGLSEGVKLLQSNNYESFSIIDSINKVLSSIGGIKKYDKEIASYYDTLNNINFELQELNRDLLYYLDNINFDEERIVYLEERIDTINKLKKKYGNTIDDILSYRQKINQRLQVLLNNEKEVEKTKNEINKIKKILNNKCEKLSIERKKISADIEKVFGNELAQLNMKNVIFKVQITKNDNYSLDGFDKIEFLISTNPGESLKPLSKIASGGEISRIMLAFKSILAEYDEIPCLIFDEVDSGISGRTAQIVGEKINSIAKKRQVICISHLPQIAALGDTHFSISKKTEDNRSITEVKKLNYEERIDELARLLGGVDLTDTTRMHAREMLSMAKKTKSKL
ncbi:DNA repair protein RecN [Anaerosalibacter sp. Marseille-P3206]|uniref:DNA repair protein RecN n=1 Tax=Anaerosalibacter sp. Marseille-P3206 TaxID=1871005 RepID=UPI0009866781|nr:DNA repair protein RecN [Anaerosalibacter sp. Marseille-P3206]